MQRASASAVATAFGMTADRVGTYWMRAMTGPVRRVMWFALLWLAGVGALALVAGVLKVMMRAL